MDYLECKFSMPQEKVDLVSTFLVAGGYDTFEICDFSDLTENAGAMFCDYIEDDLLRRQKEEPTIHFYLEKGEEARAKEIVSFVEGVCRQLGWQDVVGEIRLVENSDWDVAWKKYFYPFPVGEKLFIQPAWEEPEESAIRGRKVIRMDPAAAFGSGTHATTRLCLEAMEPHLKPGDSVLDMGCGSGILAIGAGLLGAGRICAVDIDEAAVRTTRENFEKNGLSLENVTLICGNVLTQEEKRTEMGDGYRVIFANIVAQIIKEMAPLLYQALASDGVLLASGILSSRGVEVRAALEEAGFRLQKTHLREEWLCMEFTK